MNKLTETQKNKLSEILMDDLFQKATTLVLTEKRIRSCGDVDKNAMAHSYNEGMLSFIESMNHLCGIEKQTTINPRRLK